MSDIVPTLSPPAPSVAAVKAKINKVDTGTSTNNASTNKKKGKGTGGGRSKTVSLTTDKSVVKFTGI